MTFIKIHGKNTETYYVNVSQITSYFTPVLDGDLIIRLSCGKEIIPSLSLEDFEKLLKSHN